ncbi:hypothetical protein FRC09_020787 [Ceratobasidium sp. 395]|nr:hypothetical protein FRC09_020787 [Ceratobasidium sp. 395]
MAQPRITRSSPPSTSYDPSPDTSLSTSDRSLRSIHSAPSLTSSATLSNSIQSSLNLNNIHLLPLPNSHLHIRSEPGDDSIEYSDAGSHHMIVADSKFVEGTEDDTIQALPSNIRITPSSQDRPQPERTDSEQTVAASPTRRDHNHSPEPDAQRISVLSDGYTEDDTMTEESVSGVTDELRRTLFYRPSTDPITVVQSQSSRPEPDSELNAMLNAGATSSTNLLSPPSDDPTPLPTPATNNNESLPPIRPPRPPSLNLSDADEPKPRPKSVDLARLQQGAGHSRMNSRERLGALFGKAGNRSSFVAARSSLGSGRPSPSLLGSGRPSLADARPSLGGHHSRSGSMGTAQAEVLPLSIKGKTAASAPFPTDGERVVEVRQIDVDAGGVELTRARTISGGSFAADMDRSVWEDDDTEELGTAWGMVRKWLGDESKASTSASNSLPSKKQKQGQHNRKSLSLASTFSAFRTPPTSPGFRDSTFLPNPNPRDSTLLGTHDSSGPAIRESSVLGLHESSVIAGSTSTIADNDWANASISRASRASFQTANASFQTYTGTDASFQTYTGTDGAPSTSFQTATANPSRSSVQSFHSLSTSRPTGGRLSSSNASRQSLSASRQSFNTGQQSLNASRQSLNASQQSLNLSASQPSFHSLGTSRRSFQSRRLGPRASVGSSLSSLAEPPESPTVTATRFRSVTVSSRPAPEDGEEVTERQRPRPRSQLLVVPKPESKPLFVEPEPQKRSGGSDHQEPGAVTTLPSPPSSPSPGHPRGPTTTARSLHNPTYPSLHKRLGSLVQHSTPKPSPLRSNPASPVRSQAPASPLWSQPSSSSSPRWNQSGSSSPRWSPLYPPSPTTTLYPPSPTALGMSMNMDATYKSDVRPISGITESTSYYGRGSGAGTAGRPDSGATWAGSQRELLVPPQAKTVRIIDSPERGGVGRVRDKDGHGLLPSPPPSASRVSSIFRVSPVLNGGGARQARVRRQRPYSIEYEAGLSPGKWFALGFVLGPWCWLIGGWMLDGRNRVVGVVGDAEKGVRVEGEQWVWRCRVAAVVSGVVVLVVLIVAIVYAVLGAR